MRHHDGRGAAHGSRVRFTCTFEILSNEAGRAARRHRPKCPPVLRTVLTRFVLFEGVVKSTTPGSPPLLPGTRPACCCTATPTGESLLQVSPSWRGSERF